MASDFYLEVVGKVGGKVCGESTSKGFEGQIQIETFSVGFNTHGDYATGQALSRARMDDAEFKFKASTATPTLFTMLVKNEEIKTATLTCRKQGDKGQFIKYMQWIFSKARVTSLRQSNDHDMLYDVIRIGYQKVEVLYIKQKDDGTDEVARRGENDWSGTT